MNYINYRKLLLSSPFGYAYHKVIFDDSGKPIDYTIIEANEAYQELTGLNINDIQNNSIKQLLPEIVNDPFNWIEYFGDVALNTGFKTLEQFSKPLNRWYQVYVIAPIKGFFATLFIDITNEKQKNQELEDFFSVNLDLLCIADTNGNFLKVNKEWENILGYPVEELEHRKFLDFVHPDDLDKTLEAIQNLALQKSVLNFINRYRCKDGSYRFIEWRSKPYNEIIYAAARDISDRICAEEQLQKLKELYEFAIEGSNDGIWDWNLITNELFLSRRWKEMLGYDDNELPNTYNTFDSLLHPDDRLRVNHYVKEYLDGKVEKYEMDFRMIHKDGSHRWITSRGRALWNLEGKPYRMSGVHTDNTQRIIYQQALRDSEERFRSLVGSLNDMIYTLDSNQMFTGVYGAWIEKKGLSPKYFIGKSAIDVFGEQDKLLHAESNNKALKGEIVTYDWNYASHDHVYYYQTILSPIYSSSGEVSGISGTIRDISAAIKTKLLEKEIESTKNTLQFKQNFLASMSHEIRTPLTGILGTINLLENANPSPSQTEHLNALKNASQNLRDLLDLVLDYSRIETGKIKLDYSPFKISDLISGVQSLFNSINQKSIRFSFFLDEQLPEFVFADKKRLFQIINNLILNSYKYTFEGEIFLGISLFEPLKHSTCSLLIEVKDTGPGISYEKQNDVFIPFSDVHKINTSNYEGTGLELAICKELVELMGGKIWIESESLKGTSFKFNLSVQIPKSVDTFSQPVITHKAAPQKKINILLVEDQPITQKIVKLMLSDLGHNVSIATNGKEALDLYKPGLFDLILMDIQMPVMDGITATNALKQSYPVLPPIVGLSANAFEGDRKKYISLGLDEFITKPITPEDFTKLIARLNIH